MRIILILAACAMFGGAVWAQAAVEESDGDGIYSMEAVCVAYLDVTDDVHLQIDVSEDGAVDEQELATAIMVGVLGGESPFGI